MKPIVALAMTAALALGGCATAAANISPIQVVDNRYQNATCADLSAQATLLDAHYADEARRQGNIRKLDMAGLLLVGLPVASITGHSRASQIGKLKGDRIAVTEAMTALQCPAGS